MKGQQISDLKPVGLSDFTVKARTNEKNKQTNKQTNNLSNFARQKRYFFKNMPILLECLSVILKLRFHYCFNFYQ